MMLSQKGTQGHVEQTRNRVWLPVPPPIPYCPGRRGLLLSPDPSPAYLNQSPLLPVLGLFSTVQFIMHFWELVLEIPDLSLVLFSFHLHLEQPGRKGSPWESFSWPLLIFIQSAFRASDHQAESSKSPRSLPFSVLHWTENHKPERHW